MNPSPLLHRTSVLCLALCCHALHAVEPQVVSFSVATVSARPLDTSGYQVAPPITDQDGAVEYRCYFRNQHFLSLLLDKLGGFAFRPHPGVDVNGWGTTVYCHPYLSGIALTGAAIDSVGAQADRVSVTANGVMRNGSGTQVGTWTTALQFTFDPALKKVSGTGSIAISRTQSLADGEDMNVVKLASNFLQGVPLLTCGTGNSGDTTGAVVSGSNLPPQTWNPATQPGYFPQDSCDWIDLTLPGAYNIVDTARQLNPDPKHAGKYLEPIAAAYKPSVRVRMDLQQSGQNIPFMFGAIFDTAKATDFSADNIGVTPQVRWFATGTQFTFALTIESQALPEDANLLDATLVVSHPSALPVMDALFTPALVPATWQRRGSLKRRGNGTFSATIKIPDGASGFLRGQITE